MHSRELARHAGVSVRALRHYHLLGLLDEPRRRANGYRDYAVHHLIQVLRIRRLASLGIPLARMAPLLDDPPDGAALSLLDDLDRELADQMERLARQRALIARLRADRTPPDLPPELARHLVAFATTGTSADRVRTDRNEAVLLAHLAGEDGLPHLARFYERITDLGLVPAVTTLNERLDGLGPHSSEAEVDALAEDFVTTLGPMIEEFEGVPLVDVRTAAGLFDEYAGDRFDERQRQVLARIEALLTEPR